MDPYVYPFVVLGHSGWLCRTEWLCLIPAGIIFNSRLIIRGVTWRAVPAEFKTGMCEMKSWGLRFCRVFLGTLVRDRFAEMHAVTWRAVPAEFNTGMCEMKFKGLGFCGVFSWDISSRQICGNARCNLESCSGRVQDRDV